MCGRFGLTVTWAELHEYFSLVRSDENQPEMPPRYNIAPTQPIVVIRNGFDGEREAILARWGLMPSWVKDPSSFTTLINARTETAAEKPSFRSAMRHRRVLIPANGFYEWKRFGKAKKSQPYWVKPADGEIVAFGGLMETWTSADGSEVDTACILTTDTNDGFADIHHRLPLVIHQQDFARWLDCKTQEPRDVEDLIAIVGEGYFDPIPVSRAVNKVTNDNPDIQKRVEPEAELDAPKDDQLRML